MSSNLWHANPKLPPDRRRNVARTGTLGIRLGVPALLVLALLLVALWRIGPSPATRTAIGTSGTVPPFPIDGPLVRVADTLLANSIGREASLDHVIIREMTGPDSFWAGGIDDQLVFVLLRPDVKLARGVEIQEGNEVTLTGVVRAAPDESEAVSRWHVSPATAKSLKEIGTYIEAGQVR